MVLVPKPGERIRTWTSATNAVQLFCYILGKLIMRKDKTQLHEDKKKTFNVSGECCFVWGPDVVCSGLTLLVGAWYGKSGPDVEDLIYDWWRSNWSSKHCQGIVVVSQWLFAHVLWAVSKYQFHSQPVNILNREDFNIILYCKHYGTFPV